jgi:hypothetical protein
MAELIIEPGRAGKNYWRDLWRYRELFHFPGLRSAKPFNAAPKLLFLWSSES